MSQFDSGYPEEKMPKNFSEIKKIETSINRHLFSICAVTTILAMVFILLEFFGRGYFPPSRFGTFYIGVLLIYSAHKEMLRWLGEKEVERQGEWFVYAWIGLTVSLYLINFLTKEYFCFTEKGFSLDSLQQASQTTLEVVAIFIFARFSKLTKVLREKKGS